MEVFGVLLLTFSMFMMVCFCIIMGVAFVQGFVRFVRSRTPFGRAIRRHMREQLALDHAFINRHGEQAFIEKCTQSMNRDWYRR